MHTDNNALYQVRFNGRLNFSDIQTIKNHLAQDYQKSPQDFDGWFQGTSIILKQSISHDEAKMIAEYFEKIGMIVEIQDMANIPKIDLPVLNPQANPYSAPNTDATNKVSLQKNPLGNIESIGSIGNIAPNTSDVKFAGFWIRLLALFLDSLMIVTITLMINYILSFFDLDILTEIVNNQPNLLIKLNTLDPQASQDSQILIFQELFLFISTTATFYLMLIIQIFYFALMTASTLQATFGKRIVGILVVDKNGQRLSISKSFIRSIFLNFPFAYISDIAKIGCLWVIFSSKKQGLHDRVIGSYVIYGRVNKK